MESRRELHPSLPGFAIQEYLVFMSWLQIEGITYETIDKKTNTLKNTTLRMAVLKNVSASFFALQYLLQRAARNETDMIRSRHIE